MTEVITMRHSPVLLLAVVVAVLAACDGDDFATGPLNTAPTAAFTAQCSPSECTFTNSSRDTDGLVMTSRWDFGDLSAPVTTRDAVHTYPEAGGRFIVTLTVTDNDGAVASTTRAVDVSDANVAPMADFTLTCNGLVCTFTDVSSDGDPGSVVSRSWDFGDGGSSIEANPAHGYPEPGIYTVTLTVTDDLGKIGHITKSVAVSTGLAASFTVSCSSVECRFNDTSPAAAGTIAWRWDFGDGSRSEDQNPTHVYDVTGPTTFPVTLQIWDSDLNFGEASQNIEVGPSRPDSFPPVPASAMAYNRLARHTYPSGALSRYLLDRDGTFALQYANTRFGFLEYTGRYSLVNESITLWFDANQGDWQATGTLHGDSLVVRYNIDMQLSDFEDGLYVRSQGGV